MLITWQQNELVDKSPTNEDRAQAPTLSGLISQPNKPDQMAGGQKNQSQIPTHHCRWPDCANTKGFKQPKDLRRHEKLHEPRQLFCGCCRNLGIPSKGFARKDKLLDHMRKIHQLPGTHSGKSPQGCPDGNNHNGQGLWFTTASCVDEHLRQEHSASIASANDIKTSGRLSIS